MYKLTPEKYRLVKPLIQDCSAELSVFTVLEGIMPGDVYVDSDQKPRSALIRTSETVVLAGTPYNTQFNEFIKANVLGYWENFMFDTPDWETKIPEFHKNPFIRRYTRRHLTCNNLVYTNYRNDLRPGFTLKQIEPEKLAAEGLKNTDIVMKWVGNWGNFENFRQNAAGFIIHNDDTIVSWSVTDCVFGDKAAIGIVTDQDFRRMGFAAIVSAANADYWFENGKRELDWLCIAVNKGSQATAKKLGFELKQEYYTYTTFPPYENDSDLTPDEWLEQAEYYKHAAATAPRLYDKILERCERNAKSSFMEENKNDR